MSGIIFIRYAQDQKIYNANDFNIFVNKKIEKYELLFTTKIILKRLCKVVIVRLKENTHVHRNNLMLQYNLDKTECF